MTDRLPPKPHDPRKPWPRLIETTVGSLFVGSLALLAWRMKKDKDVSNRER